MRDLVDDPGFVHLPPRERLVRHCEIKIRDRVLGHRPSREEYEALVAHVRDGRGKRVAGPATDREEHLVEFWGARLRVVYDLRYDAVVTVMRGWYPRDRVDVRPPRGVRRGGRPRY